MLNQTNQHLQAHEFFHGMTGAPYNPLCVIHRKLLSMAPHDHELAEAIETVEYWARSEQLQRDADLCARYNSDSLYINTPSLCEQSWNIYQQQHDPVTHREEAAA